MVSTSSKKMIAERARIYWHENCIWGTIFTIGDLELIHFYLSNEYQIIPEKERIGKGSVYISKVVAETTIDLLMESERVNPLETINLIFHFPDTDKTFHMKNYAIALLGEYACTSKQAFNDAIVLVKITIDNCEWEVREQCGIVIRKTLKKYPNETLALLEKWIESPSENLRRLSIESTRPMQDIPWLRDSNKNIRIIEMLSKLKTDKSLYVRKSVGNNLKDLTKYMPEEILELMSKWIKEAKIQVTDDLASKYKKEIGEENYNLVWTLKHGLRWLKERNPEFHEKIEQLLGKNYLLYYNEKLNKMAVKK
jgi:3-methyladenine DNA glycosylase AlkC